MPRVLLDIRPLRESPDFRRLWAGQSLSAIGGQMTAFSVILQVYQITHSSGAVGAAGLIGALPSLLFAGFAGPLGDRYDRRRLVLLTSSMQASVSILFAAQALAGLRQVGVLYVLIAVQSLVGAVNAPARRAITPRLLPRELLAAGGALNQLTMQVSLVCGPALAGLVAAAWGLKFCYVVDAISFGAALYGIGRLPAVPPAESSRKGPTLRAAGEAVRHVFAHKELLGAFLADMCIGVIGVPVALFPAINAERFGGSAATLGLLTAAEAVGGVLGSAFSGLAGHVRRLGRAALIACALYGLAIVGFGLAHTLWLALALLVLAGAADVICVVFHSTVVQLATPDELRGRISSLEFMVGVGGTRLGSFRGGVFGSLFGATASVTGGGLAAVVGAGLIRIGLPAFHRFDVKDHQEAEEKDDDRVPAAAGVETGDAPND